MPPENGHRNDTHCEKFTKGFFMTYYISMTDIFGTTEYKDDKCITTAKDEQSYNNSIIGHFE